MPSLSIYPGESAPTLPVVDEGLQTTLDKALEDPPQLPEMAEQAALMVGGTSFEPENSLGHQLTPRL